MTVSRLLAPFRRRRGWTEPYADTQDGRVALRPRSGARVHLGCGDMYLAEYLNVDFPPALGVASGTSRPDVEADIVALDCTPGALAEVRLHHVFEHFERAVALALLVRWYEWLEPGGTLTIETPDFERCVEGFAGRPLDEQTLILRHLFGSQEAAWAYHLDGWSARRFDDVLTRLGFEQVASEETSWSDERRLLANVVVRAVKPSLERPREERVSAARSILRLSMNGAGASEEQVAMRWVETFERTLAG